MKNYFENPKHILIVAAYTLCTAVVFAAGCLIGAHTGGGMQVQSEPVTVKQVPAAETAATQAVPQKTAYRVIIEDGELRLYMDKDGSGRLISNEPISEASFPSRDIAELKEGKAFDTLDDALAMMENFLS